MDQPKIERLLRLMKMMSGNTNYTIDELAELLGTSYRSIYRYIDTFKESGFVVEKLHSNVYKLGKMPKSYVDLKRLIYFSEEEAYIINSLINSLDNTSIPITVFGNIKYHILHYILFFRVFILTSKFYFV